MIRQPTPARVLYAWWRAAVAGEALPRHDGLPEAGWYKARLVKGGPWVPARIWIEREIDPETCELADDERFACEIDGMRVDAAAWWLSLKPVSRDEYDELLRLRDRIPAMQASMRPIDLTETIMRPS